MTDIKKIEQMAQRYVNLFPNITTRPADEDEEIQSEEGYSRLNPGYIPNDPYKGTLPPAPKGSKSGEVSPRKK